MLLQMTLLEMINPFGHPAFVCCSKLKVVVYGVAVKNKCMQNLIPTLKRYNNPMRLL